MLTAIAAFIGRIIREVLPAIFAEWRKPQKTKQVGYTDAIQEDIEQTITDAVTGDIDRRMQQRLESGHAGASSKESSPAD